MSIWIELHCDVRDGGRKLTGSPGCSSDDNESPGVMVSNGSAAIGQKMVTAMARDLGWKRHSIGWVCPACEQKKRSATAPEQHDPKAGA